MLLLHIRIPLLITIDSQDPLIFLMVKLTVVLSFASCPFGSMGNVEEERSELLVGDLVPFVHVGDVGKLGVAEGFEFFDLGIVGLDSVGLSRGSGMVADGNTDCLEGTWLGLGLLGSSSFCIFTMGRRGGSSATATLSSVTAGHGSAMGEWKLRDGWPMKRKK